jgi:putative alpha-1,2-mannosidase
VVELKATASKMTHCRSALSRVSLQSARWQLAEETDKHVRPVAQHASPGHSAAFGKLPSVERSTRRSSSKMLGADS